MILVPLKSGKTLSVSSYDALLGTVWVSQISWKKADIPKDVKIKLRNSVKREEE